MGGMQIELKSSLYCWYAFRCCKCLCVRVSVSSRWRGWLLFSRSTSAYKYLTKLQEAHMAEAVEEGMSHKSTARSNTPLSSVNSSARSSSAAVLVHLASPQFSVEIVRNCSFSLTAPSTALTVCLKLHVWQHARRPPVAACCRFTSFFSSFLSRDNFQQTIPSLRRSWSTRRWAITWLSTRLHFSRLISAFFMTMNVFCVTCLYHSHFNRSVRCTVFSRFEGGAVARAQTTTRKMSLS